MEPVEDKSIQAGILALHTVVLLQSEGLDLKWVVGGFSLAWYLKKQ